MANSNKNIVITPNIGSSTADPKIVFSGADASTAAQNITMTVYPANGGTLSIDGSNGQLFSVSNVLTGTLFSVNDISGIPSIEVLDTGGVKLAQYNGTVAIGANANSAIKLHVEGGSLGLAVNVNSNHASGVYQRFTASGSAIGDIGSALQLFGSGTVTDFGLNSRAGLNLVFGTNQIERMRLSATNGNLLVNTTSDSGAKIRVNFTGASEYGLRLDNQSNGGNPAVQFAYATTTQVGTITTTTTTTAYNTSSDQRMKTNIADAPSAIAKLKAVQVRSFDWSVGDEGHVEHGFIAQELQTAEPHAVTEGRLPEDMWGVDNAKLVPMLVKALQEAFARIEALEAK
jgi:hypothetical protein